VNKLDKIGVVDLKTGTLYENGAEVFESIKRDDYNSENDRLKRKFQQDPYSMTLKELQEYKKRFNKTKDVLKFEKGSFFTASKINDSTASTVSLETLGVLFLVSGYVNKHGVILYGNNKPIPSFEKLRVKLSIGNTKWNRVKKEIDQKQLINKIKVREAGNRCVLVVNPFYTYTSTEIGEVRFLAYGDLFKELLDLEDYLILCKRFDIVPEFESK